MDSERGLKWVLPSNIPFADLKGADLEECLYWVLDGLGARDIEWRLGGAGGGAPDGGRDIEAAFYALADTGEMVRQRWWIECKGRSGTVEADQVKVAANNALAQTDLDVLVIATNTRFSNPTRDWVKVWQTKFPRPRIELWDAVTLERLLVGQPGAVFRLYSNALSLEGKLEVCRERFWSKFEFGSESLLEEAWTARKKVEIGAFVRIALIGNEFNHGDIEQRPWGGLLNGDEAVDVLNHLTLNMKHLIARCLISKGNQQALIKTIAYVISIAIRSVDSAQLARALICSISREGQEASQETIDLLLGPVIGSMHEDLRSECPGNCPRYPRYLSSEQVLRPEGSFWARFRDRGITLKKPSESRLIRFEKDAPCGIGLDLSQWDNDCPLFHKDTPTLPLEQFFSIVDAVMLGRLGEQK